MLAPQHACAQETAQRLIDALPLAQVQALTGETPIRETILALLRGEIDAAELFKSILPFAQTAKELPVRLAGILVPVGIWACCPLLLGEKGARSVGVMCGCALCASLCALLGPLSTSALESSRRIAALCEGAAPVLSALLSASGGVNSAALLTPASSLAAQMCTSVICRITIPASVCAGALALCPAFSARFSFEGFRRLITGACTWIHAGMLGLFTSLLGMRGLIKSGADSLSMQTARYTVDSLLPVVGGDVADSLGLLIASARAVRGCFGVVCCVLLLAIAADPLLLAAADYILVKLCCALIQPLGIDGAEKILNGFADAFRSLLIAVICAAMLFVLLAGSCAALAGRIAV